MPEKPDGPVLLTCITCGVGFRDGDLQRAHYKSDWHRYNLKRKVVDLPCVTEEEFIQRQVLLAQAQKETNASSSRYCEICKKNFGTEKAYNNHITSRRHTMQIVKNSSLGIEPKGLSQDLQTKCVIAATENKEKNSTSASEKKAKPEVMDTNESDDSEEWEEIEGTPIPVTDCLFCSHECDDMMDNIEHMSVAHSFFIPDFEYCVDIEGLMEYLGSKVGEGMVCLWCNDKGKQYYTVDAVQQHMRDKGHCKLAHEEGNGALEYSDFYDYSSSYPDGETANPEEIYQPQELAFNDNMQLVLPSGITVGHRALKIYYKQRLRPTRDLVTHKSIKKNNILSKYKALGYGETSIVAAQKKFRDQRYMKHVNDKYRVKLGLNGNKTMQTHFRNQVMF